MRKAEIEDKGKKLLKIIRKLARKINRNPWCLYSTLLNTDCNVQYVANKSQLKKNT